MTIELKTESGDNHLALVGGEPLIFHCHHYNVVLQQSIEESSALLPELSQVLRDGAVVPPYVQFKDAFAGKPVEERLAFGAEYYRDKGFGLLDLSGLKANGGTVQVKNSHYAMGFESRKHTGNREDPADIFTCGFLEGFAAAAFDKAVGSYRVTETACKATGGSVCTFQVELLDSPLKMADPVGRGKAPSSMPARPAWDSPVDEAKILQALSGLPLGGNEEGSIPAFGVYLTRHYANYYNHISFEFERLIRKRQPQLVEAASNVLVEAGHVCAFNTFGGIMTSPEWEGLILPMIKERRDWVYGIVSCINALGWGRYSVVEAADEKLVMRVDDTYESNYYLQAHGHAEHPICYFVRGATAGIMNLLYTGDITTKPTLDGQYYHKLFSGAESFRAQEVSCRGKGDAHCQFVVERQKMG